MENGMFWSEIGSGFKKTSGTPPPKIPRIPPPPPPIAYTAAPFQYAFDTHARINAIKMGRFTVKNVLPYLVLSF